MKRGYFGSERGVGLIEVLVSLVLFLACLTAAASVTIDSTKRNKSRQMAMMVQADARNSLSMIENTLRTAGWDPRNVGFAGLVLDSTPSGPDNFIEAVADLNGDGDTTDDGEDVTIRHHEGRIEWRRTWDTTQPFVTLAENISNDQNGDGTIEATFLPDSTVSPRRITVTITARSPAPDPISKRYLVHTLSSDVVLRARL